MVWTRWYVSQSLSNGNTPFEKGLAHIGQRALTAGANALADMSDNNTPIKEALKKQVKSEISALNPINRLKVLASEPRKCKAPQNRTQKEKKVA